MEIIAETMKSGKGKESIDEMNVFATNIAQKLDLPFKKLIIFWDPKKFESVLEREEIAYSLDKGISKFALVKVNKKDEIEVYFNYDILLEEEISIDFFKYAFLHEMAHLSLPEDEQFLIKDVEMLQAEAEELIKRKNLDKSFLKFIELLNYCLDEIYVDYSFFNRCGFTRKYFKKALREIVEYNLSVDVFGSNSGNYDELVSYIILTLRYCIPSLLLDENIDFKFFDFSVYFSEATVKQIEHTCEKMYGFIFNPSTKLKDIREDYSQLLTSFSKLYLTLFNMYSFPPKMVIKPFIFEKGEKTLSLEWAKNENFLHFLLKFGVVYQLLSHGFDISNIKIEKRIGSARADILASRRGINYWIECETAIDDEFSKMKDLKKYSKGFKGRKIVVSPFSNFYPAPVKNMIKNSEWWLMQFKYPSIICFGIRKDKEGNRWLLLDEFSQSYVKRITGLRFKRGYIDYLWLEQN